MRTQATAIRTGALLSGSTSVLLMALGLATGAMLARILGPEGRGLLMQIMFWPELIAVLFTFSLGDALIYRLKRDPGGTKDRKIALARFAVGLSGILCLGAIGFGYFAVPLLADLSPQDLSRARFFLVAVVLSHVLSIVLNGFQRSEHNFVYMTVERLCLPLVYAGLLTCFFVSGYGSIDAIIWCHVIGIGVALAYRLRIASGWLFARIPPAFDVGLLRDALAMHGHTVMVISALQIDRLLVVTLMEARDIGYYVIALAIASVFPGLIRSVLQVIAMPAITNIPAAARNEGIARMLRLTFMTLIAGGAAVLAVIPFAVPLLFGRAFEPMTGLASAMVIAAAPGALRHMFAQIYLGLGKARFAMLCDGVYLSCFAVAFAGAMAAGATWAVVWAVAIGNYISLCVCVALLQRAGLVISPGEWFTLRPAAVREYAELISAGVGELLARRRLAQGRP